MYVNFLSISATNRNIKIKESGNKNNGENNSNQYGSNEDESNFNEIKELNFQEKARLHELYEASRSLSCPLEQDKDVSRMIVLSQFVINYKTCRFKKSQ